MLLMTAVTFSSGCRTVSEGNPPPKVVEIKVSEDEVMTFSEAVNLVSTELAVNVFSGRSGDIKIFFKNNSGGDAVVRKLYDELKIFVPVKAVRTDYAYIIESIYLKNGENIIWQVILKKADGKIVWHEQLAVKD